DKECESGKFYVYHLPSIFNIELLQNCNGLDPWRSYCEAISYHGLGPIATPNGLAGIVPDSLAPAWHLTDQFALEVTFHARALHHKCRTVDPESATAFYIPFYAGLAVNKYLWGGNCSSQERDYHPEMLLRWVQEQHYWKRSNGSDHFLALGRVTWDFRRGDDEGWGSSFLRMPAVQNVTRLLIERDPWDYREIGVPYPTGFHPRSHHEVLEWQNYVRTHKRKSLFTFVGGTRGVFKNDFREILLRQCVNESDSCNVVDCSVNNDRCAMGNSAILEAFLEADFCLQPRGDSYTRRSVFDCMVAGSIPVFFWNRTAYDQYELFLPVEPESYSVFIDHNQVKNGTSIRGVLEQFSREEVRKMREKVIDHIPKIVYAKPQEGLETIKDAFDIAIDGVLRRFKLEE
ncbi:Exostosin domain-containing protein, partial [Cephalotus follicularis]